MSKHKLNLKTLDTDLQLENIKADVPTADGETYEIEFKPMTGKTFSQYISLIKSGTIDSNSMYQILLRHLLNPESGTVYGGKFISDFMEAYPVLALNVAMTILTKSLELYSDREQALKNSLSEQVS